MAQPNFGHLVTVRFAAALGKCLLTQNRVNIANRLGNAKAAETPVILDGQEPT